MGSEYSVRYQYMPDGNWHGSLDQMKQILDATDPGKVSQAGQTYKAASDKFHNTSELLRRELPKLREAWTGKVAEEAIGKLEKLLRQADTMHTASSNIAASLADHGEKLKWYKENQPGPGMFDGVDWGDVAAFSFGGLVGLGAKKLFMEDAEDKAATEFMTRLSGRTIEANNMMPTSVTDDNPAFGDVGEVPPPPPPPPPVGPGTGPGGGGSNSGLPSFQDSMGSGGGGGSSPKVPSLPNSDPYGSGGSGSGAGGAGNGNLPNGIGGVGSDGGGSGSGSGRLPSGVGGIGGGDGAGGIGGGLPDGLGNADPYGSQGSRLASATPNLPGAGLDGLGPGGGGAGGGGMSGFGGGAGGGVGGGSGLASNGFGPGGAMGAGAGAGAGRGFGAGGTAAGTGGRGMGAPMGGHGGGRGEEERERSTWLTEDEDVWGGDADTAPPVIG